MQLMTVDSTEKMSSKEMSELTEKRHDSVKRTIDTLAEKGVISQPQIVDGEKSANGVVEKLYMIGKRDSYVIVAQLSPEFTARLVDRWQMLEERNSQQAPALPLSPVELKLGEQLGIARLFEVPLHLAQVEAVKNINTEMGIDLQPWLKLAPAQDNIKADDVFLEPTEIGRLFGVDGKFINAGLLNVGLQTKVGNTYKPSNEAEIHAQHHQWTKGNKSGMNLKWRLSFVKTQLNLKEAA